MTQKLEWRLSDKDPLVDIGSAIARTTTELAVQQVADLADYFPFKRGWTIRGHVDEDWFIACITENYSSSIPQIVDTLDEIADVKRILLPFAPRSHAHLYKLLGPEWFSHDRFTYVGPFRDSFACWPDVNQHLVDWLNHLVLPDVLTRNRARVLRAIPEPPKFSLEMIRRACWVLECEESMTQGTAFHLTGSGLVTCQHVLGQNTVAFRPVAIGEKYPVTIVSQNKTIDLAVLRIECDLVDGLTAGSADNLREMDHLAVVGFPNYRRGDTGVIIPGLVVGFRTVSAIRRILTNAPIIAGNSGGPVVDGNNKVVGVAVTGADSMQTTQETENHGIIPINALQYLL